LTYTSLLRPLVAIGPRPDGDLKVVEANLATRRMLSAGSIEFDPARLRAR